MFVAASISRPPVNYCVVLKPVSQCTRSLARPRGQQCCVAANTTWEMKAYTIDSDVRYTVWVHTIRARTHTSGKVGGMRYAFVLLHRKRPTCTGWRHALSSRARGPTPTNEST
ncbi:hypothetical protein LSAT2_012980 [Lamellibrachia satsuma]|nr:hypothetical protein LSAT2_012980 [Lamellibrachia satsuma]